jgi:hypothetical protein
MRIRQLPHPSLWIVVSFLLLLLCPQVSRADILTGLVAYYPLDGNANDASGNGYDLTLFGIPGFASGQFGQALSLDGTGDQYAARPISDPAFDFGGGDFTVQVWVNFASRDPGEQTLIEKFHGAGGPGWTLTTPGNDLQFYLGGAVNAGFTWDTGTWYQVVAVRSGSTLSLFVNDDLIGSGSPGSNPGVTDPLLLGRRDAQDGRNFGVNGLLDDVAIWDRALSQDEISSLYSDGLPSTGAVPEPSTVSLLSFGMLLLCWKRLTRAR